MKLLKNFKMAIFVQLKFVHDDHKAAEFLQILEIGNDEPRFWCIFREREKENERRKARLCVCVCESESVPVCVCEWMSVCVRERKKMRPRKEFLVAFFLSLRLQLRQFRSRFMFLSTGFEALKGFTRSDQVTRCIQRLVGICGGTRSSLYPMTQ